MKRSPLRSRMAYNPLKRGADLAKRSGQVVATEKDLRQYPIALQLRAMIIIYDMSSTVDTTNPVSALVPAGSAAPDQAGSAPLNSVA